MGNREVLFSIIVPIYNVENYLEECVESILAQTYPVFELILVDDGSQDACPTMCDAYQKNDPRIKVIHKENGGLVSARKAGAAIAIGEYVICVDGDDWVAKDYLLELYHVIQKCEPDIICFHYFNATKETFKESNIPIESGHYTRKDIEEKIFPCLIQTTKGGYFPPSIWSKAYKMELYREEQLQIDDKVKIAEDVACSVSCIARAKNLYILNKHLYYYRTNDTSMTKVKKPFDWKGQELVDEHLRRRLKNHEYDFDAQINRRTVHGIITVLTTQFYSGEKYRQIVKSAKEHLKNTTYHKAIQKSRFSFFSAVGIFHFFLKYKLFFPFYILSKIK